MMEHPCPLYTRKPSLLTEALRGYGRTKNIVAATQRLVWSRGRRHLRQNHARTYPRLGLINFEPHEPPSEASRSSIIHPRFIAIQRMEGIGWKRTK